MHLFTLKKTRKGRSQIFHLPKEQCLEGGGKSPLLLGARIRRENITRSAGFTAAVQFHAEKRKRWWLELDPFSWGTQLHSQF